MTRNDLLQERSALMAKMENIQKAAETEKRTRTESELKEFNAYMLRVDSLTAEINDLNKVEAINRQIAEQKDPEIQKAKRLFSMTNAIKGVRNGNLTGLEKEVNDEALRELSGVQDSLVGNLFLPSWMIARAYKRTNEETKTTGLASGHLPLDVAAADMGLVVPSPLYREMGATIYENLVSGKLDIPFSKGHTADMVSSEAGAASQSVPTTTKGTLSAERFHGWQKYTAAYLAESAVMPSMLSDMVAAIDRGVGKALLLDMVASNVLTGAATSDTKAALTWALVTSLIQNLDSESFMNEGYVMSKQVFFKLAATVKESGAADMILKGTGGRNMGEIFGIKAAGSGFLPVHDTDKYDFIYGDWRQAYVGFWGGVQLLIDPFTASDNGYTKISFSRIGDVVTNPYAFISRRNVSL